MRPEVVTRTHALPAPRGNPEAAENPWRTTIEDDGWEWLHSPGTEDLRTAQFRVVMVWPKRHAREKSVDGKLQSSLRSPFRCASVQDVLRITWRQASAVAYGAGAVDGANYDVMAAYWLRAVLRILFHLETEMESEVALFALDYDPRSWW